MLSSYTRRLDSARSAPALFIALAVLLLLMFAPTRWSGNEENYLQLSYRRVAPEQFGPNSAVFDQSRSRAAAEAVLGYPVKWFGYDGAHAVLRISMALLYAGALSIFFSAVGVSMLDALFIVSAFVLSGERLLGDEWLFWGVESKTFAYSLVIAALGLACRNRWSLSIVLTAAATYFHFLVGGFWAGMVVLYEWLREKDTKRAVLNALLFAALVAPLVFVILQDLSIGNASIAERASADVIYASRVSHHVAPFTSAASFWVMWFPRIIAAGVLLGVLIVMQRRKLLPPIAVLTIIGLSYALVALLIAFGDRHTNRLAKFYLFRPTTLTLFIAITAIVWAAKRYSRPEIVRALMVGQAAVIAGHLAITLASHGRALIKEPLIAHADELVAAVEANSAPDDIVLLEPFNEMFPEYQRLHRVIHRPTLVSQKFLPTNVPDIHRWFDLIQRRERLFASGCAEPMQPPVKLLVVFRKDVAARMHACGETVWQTGNTTVIRVAGSH